MRIKTIIAVFFFLLFGFLADPYVARSEYTHDPINTIDPALLKVDEDNYLGSKLDRDMIFTGSDGEEFSLGSMLDKPLILALSYFECDGICLTINQDLKNTLQAVDGLVPGQDYRVLTVSFNKDDTAQTMKMFADKLALSERFIKGWKVATLNSVEDIETLTKSVGYNYFWSKRDRVFIHPNVFIFISPEGIVSRYLYGANLKGFDIEVAIAKAGFGTTARSKFKDMTNLLLVACYSYNFKEGSFVLNYPLFIAVGSLLSSVSLVLFSIFFYKKKRRR